MASATPVAGKAALPVGSTKRIAPTGGDAAELASIIIEVAENYRSWLEHECTKALYSAGLFVRGFRGAEQPSGKRKLFIQVFASEERLLLEAERIKMRLNLDKKQLKGADITENRRLVDEEGVSFSVVGGDSEHVDLSIPEPEPSAMLTCCNCLRRRKLREDTPYEHMYAPYIAEERLAKLYYKHTSTQSVLSQMEAIKLLRSIIEAPQNPTMQGAGLNLDRLMVREKKIIRWFPAHDPQFVAALEQEWAGAFQMPWNQPITRVKNYFGEKLGFYFAFLSFYTRWLIVPALVGIAIFAHQVISKTPAVDYLPAYGIFVALWSTFFVEFWKREQNTWAMKWGMTKFKLEEQPRPGFTANEKLVRSFVDGKPSYEEDPTEYRLRTTGSGVLITTFLGIVIVVVGCIFWVRVLLVKSESNNGGKLPNGWGDYITSIIVCWALAVRTACVTSHSHCGTVGDMQNAVQIQVMNKIYNIMAYKLTDCENHKTQTRLVVKLSLFYTINSYFGLVYIAAIKNSIVIAGQTQQCALNKDGEPDCMGELQSQLAILLLTRFALGLVFELILPWTQSRVMRVLNACRYRRNPEMMAKITSFEMSQSAVEAESTQPTYDSFEDYLEVAIQWGFITLFVVAFPIAPAIALVASYIELRIDTFKVLHLTSRPMPASSQDIGAWQLFFEALSYLSTITNLTIVVFTNQAPIFGHDWSGYQRLVFFIVAEHILLVLKYAISTYIPDITFRTQLQLARQEYLVNKHIFGVRDVEPGALKRTGSGAARMASMMALDEEERRAIADARAHGMSEGGNWRIFRLGGGANTNCQLSMATSYNEMVGLPPPSADVPSLSGAVAPGPSAIMSNDGQPGVMLVNPVRPAGPGGTAV